jgi:hypothetical protein
VTLPGLSKSGYEGATELDIKSNGGETQVVRCEPKRSAWESFEGGQEAAFVCCRPERSSSSRRVNQHGEVSAAVRKLTEHLSTFFEEREGWGERI